MLTPTFHITQTDEKLHLVIDTPYHNPNTPYLEEDECVANGKSFLFFSSPYILRLFLPCEVEDNDDVQMIEERGHYIVELKKKQVGQYFPDLDLPGTLLAPKPTFKPNIEVVSDTQEAPEVEEDDDDEWYIEQEIPTTTEPCVVINAPKYGFGNLTQGVFKQVKSTFNEIIDLPEPDNTPAGEREPLRRTEEDQLFCGDHYLADFMETEAVEQCITYKPYWQKLNPQTVKLTVAEKETLKRLGNKEFLLEKEEKTAAWLSLVDIIFAYAYNHRTTYGENTVESAWTINKLSATLSWLATHNSLHNVVICCFRRVLTYPLYRNWDLTQLVLKDTIDILKLGRRQVLKCLLEVHSLFSHSELRYMLNKLYISDYCIWLQRVSESKLSNLTASLEQILISKSDVGFELEELEQAALLVQKEEEEQSIEKTIRKIENLTLQQSSSSSSDSDSSSNEDLSSTLDSDDYSSLEN